MNIMPVEYVIHYFVTFFQISIPNIDWEKVVGVVESFLSAGAFYLVLEWIKRYRTKTQQVDEHTDNINRAAADQSKLAVENVKTAQEVNDMLQAMIERERVQLGFQLERERQHLNTQLESAKKVCEEQINVVREANNEQIAVFRKRSSEDVDKLKKDHQLQINSINYDREQTKRALELVIDDLRGKLSDLKQRLSKYEVELETGKFAAITKEQELSYNSGQIPPNPSDLIITEETQPKE